MSPEERNAAFIQRVGRNLPWHSPPHLDFEGPITFITTAACFEHSHIIGKDIKRMAYLESELLSMCEGSGAKIFAWCILPNHYHLLIRTENIKHLRKEIGKIHGRTARFWNVEDNSLGRQVWFNFFDRDMKSDGHFWASLNYIHNNPVHHGYVEKWQDWPFSSANRFLDNFGRDEVARIWKEYPILDYGKGWDIY